MTDQGPEGAIADAVKGNWVDTRAPDWAVPYLRLSRADRPIGTWLLLVPCWWGLLLAMMADGQARFEDLWIFLGCGAGAYLMRGAGCTWNDITDRHIDGKVARTALRPIPSGQVSTKQALAWAVAQALVAFAILLTFHPMAILLGILSLLPVAVYPFAKRFTWWPQVFLGLAFNWGALLGWTAHSGQLGWPALVLYLGGIAWTLFYDTIYAHQDTEDDALIGVKSTARLFAENSMTWLRGFACLAPALMAFAVSLVAQSGVQLGLALIGVLGFALHMFWQLKGVNFTDSENLVRTFRANRDTGLIPVIFFALALFG